MAAAIMIAAIAMPLRISSPSIPVARHPIEANTALFAGTLSRRNDHRRAADFTQRSHSSNGVETPNLALCLRPDRGASVIPRTKERSGLPS
jgi:hypothetical protein